MKSEKHSTSHFANTRISDFMALLDFRKKAKEQKEEPSEFAGDNELPEELEKFRTRARFGPPAEKDEPFLPEEYKKNIDEPAVQKENKLPQGNLEHKIELVLSKLETIDARLRLLEEKLKRFG